MRYVGGAVGHINGVQSQVDILSPNEDTLDNDRPLDRPPDDAPPPQTSELMPPARSCPISPIVNAEELLGVDMDVDETLVESAHPTEQLEADEEIDSEVGSEEEDGWGDEAEDENEIDYEGYIYYKVE